MNLNDLDEFPFIFKDVHGSSLIIVDFIVSASRSPPGLGSDTASRSPPGRGHRFAQSAVSWKYVVFHSLCATLVHFCVNSGPFLTPFFVLWGHF